MTMTLRWGGEEILKIPLTLTPPQLICCFQLMLMQCTAPKHFIYIHLI